MLQMPDGKNFERSKQAFTELMRSLGCTYSPASEFQSLHIQFRSKAPSFSTAFGADGHFI